MAFDISDHGFFRLMLGVTKTTRLTSAGSSIEGEIYAIQAINGDAIFDSGCEVDIGDAPQEDDTITQDSIRYGRFTKVTPPKSGVFICYHVQ